MTDLWDETLQPASFAGIEFPVASRSLGGGRALARKRYPNRPGQSVEETGREPYTFELEIPLFADVEPEHYPNTFESLRYAFDDPDTGALAEYVDPELGPLQAQVDTWTWRTAAGARNGGVLTVKLEEVSHEDFVLTTSTRDAQRSAEDAAAEIDERIGDLGISEEDLEQSFLAGGVPLSEDEKDKLSGELWSTQVTRFVESIEDGISTAEEMAARLDGMRRRIDILVNLPGMQAPAAAFAHHAAMRLGASLVEMGDELVSRAPPLVEHIILSEQSVYEVASQLYGSPDRAAEILQRNPSPSPLFLPAGTRLVVLSS